MAKKFFPVLALLLVFQAALFAGTGGSEIASWYTTLSSALQGTWGKIAAAAFIGMSLLALKQGGIVPGIFLFLLGISVGTIPQIIDARYTMLF